MEIHHHLSEEITDAQITDFITDGPALAYLHLSNGYVIALSAGTVGGQPYLYVTRAFSKALH